MNFLINIGALALFTFVIYLIYIFSGFLIAWMGY